jgi:hypothetical protein
VPVGFCKWISFEFLSGFEFFLGFRFFRFLSGFRFFRVSGAPAGEKRNPHPNPVLRGSGSGHGCKNAPEPAPVGCKTRGLPETRTAIPMITLCLF